MQPVPVPLLSPAARIRSRTALVASADASFRHRLSEILTGLRWQVREAEGGAQAWKEAESAVPEAVIVDSWLPDLDLGEFLADFRDHFPQVDLLTASGSSGAESPRGPYRQELLYAMRRAQETDAAAWITAPVLTRLAPGPAQIDAEPQFGTPQPSPIHSADAGQNCIVLPLRPKINLAKTVPIRAELAKTSRAPLEEQKAVYRLPELIGNAPCMLEVSRRIRLVAQRMTPVLIEGPTGSGKELVAEGLHRLSTRSKKPFVAINCAAIPEALLEAELFGHTRGAFTGAVHGRVGRIESADGGTLFLDEIGEMPLALQSKLLRFVECSELQRVGDNETVKVDVRIVAATHRQLAEHTKAGTFRADLYYRLAVFLIRTPALMEHAQDLPILVDHFLQKMGREAPIKRIDAGAMAKLAAHSWPGNVRELEHVLERAGILAGDEPLLTVEEIDFGSTVN
ncbi:MAG: sigma 54-interacting transcriptional regulator [Terracidiphilus sp.]